MRNYDLETRRADTESVWWGTEVIIYGHSSESMARKLYGVIRTVYSRRGTRLDGPVRKL